VTIAELGSLGEFVASVGVLITLIFIIVQIRQNTAAVTRASIRQSNEGNSRALKSLLDEDVSELFIKGLKSLDSLSEVERYRFDNAFYQWLSAQEQAFLDRREGALSGDSFVTYENVVPGFLITVGGKKWWEERCVWFAPSFRDDVDRLISQLSTEASGSGPVL